MAKKNTEPTVPTVLEIIGTLTVGFIAAAAIVGIAVYFNTVLENTSRTLKIVEELRDRPAVRSTITNGMNAAHPYALCLDTGPEGESVPCK